MSVLLGGVGQLYQGDLDLGRLAVERLAGQDLGRDVVVEDLFYGAVAVAQRVQELRPHTLILVGAAARGRPPGAVTRRRVDPVDLDPAMVQGAVADAVTGYVHVDLVVDVAWGLGVLPARTVLVDVEPARTDPSERLSPEAAAGLEQALDLVRAEARRAPLLALTDEIRATLRGSGLERSPARDALEALLVQLEIVDLQGRWARTFAERDRLRLRIASGQTGEGMNGLDWCLWWNLIEELDRLQALEAIP